MDYRIEVDSLGEVQVPIDALYGAQTTRAISNFTITRLTTHPKMIQAIGMVKKAAAIANFECGYLDQERLDYIIQACDEVISGLHNDSFITDVIQGGAGTSVNMCANEVIANRAAQLANREIGVYDYVSGSYSSPAVSAAPFTVDYSKYNTAADTEPEEVFFPVYQLLLHLLLIEKISQTFLLLCS